MENKQTPRGAASDTRPTFLHLWPQSYVWKLTGEEEFIIKLSNFTIAFLNMNQFAAAIINNVTA